MSSFPAKDASGIFMHDLLRLRGNLHDLLPDLHTTVQLGLGGNGGFSWSKSISAGPLPLPLPLSFHRWG